MVEIHEMHEMGEASEILTHIGQPRDPAHQGGIVQGRDQFRQGPDLHRDAVEEVLLESAVREEIVLGEAVGGGEGV